MTTTIAEFMAAAPAGTAGNSPWATRYAAELRRVVHEHARLAPRNLQVHLGPSELGTPCDRQVVGKLIGAPVTNHVADPWPSVLGVAGHAWLADAFRADNERHGLRWVPEQKVVPHPDHPGTADLYDAAEQAVVDHKLLGATSMEKVRAAGGPPIRYVVQLLLYGEGYRQLGLPVRRVALAAYPRTAPNLDGLYVWERECTDNDRALLDAIFELTATRKQLAEQVLAGTKTLNGIPKRASDDECYFCPFYRPQSAKDDGPGCSGPRK